MISASFDDGALLAVAAVRPAGVEGHDAEAVGAVLVAPDGEATRLHEALLSTEYDADGRARRLGLELYEGPGEPPVRVGRGPGHGGTPGRRPRADGAEAAGSRARPAPGSTSWSPATKPS